MGKYETQAEILSNEITKLINGLGKNDVVGVFNIVEKSLAEVNDSDYLKDNVLIVNKEIKEKLEKLKADISGYAGQVKWKANMLDKEYEKLLTANANEEEIEEI